MSQKIFAAAHWDGANVRLLIHDNGTGQVNTTEERAIVTLGRQQAIALAYRLLHAANDGFDEVQSMPALSVREPILAKT